MSQVLGLAFADQQIASVVMDATTGETTARNVMDLPQGTAQEAFDAIVDMVNTAPFPTTAVTIACTDSAMIEQLSTRFAQYPQPPEWFSRVTVIDGPTAYAQCAAARSPLRGQVAVLDVAADGAPHGGFSVAVVDTQTAAVLGAAAPTFAEREPVTVADGATALSEALATIPAQPEQGFLLIGSGADVPGVAIAVEYLTQCPVVVAPDAVYASAEGAALAAMAGSSRRSGLLAGVLTGPNRWVAFMAATVAGLLLAGGIIAGIMLSGNDSERATTVGNETDAGTTSSWPETLPSPSSTSVRSAQPAPEQTSAEEPQPGATPPPQRPTQQPPRPPRPPQPTAPRPTKTPPPQTTTPATTTTPTTTTPTPDDGGGESEPNAGEAALGGTG